MKLKLKLLYKLFKIFPRKFVKFFNRLYEHRLNFNILDLMNRGLKIDVIYDIGAFRGEWSNFLSRTSLKNKKFYLFEANKENEKYLEKLSFKYFFGVLSDKKKDVNFYSRISTGDSYLVEQTSFYKENIKSVIKKVTGYGSIPTEISNV